MIDLPQCVSAREPERCRRFALPPHSRGAEERRRRGDPSRAWEMEPRGSRRGAGPAERNGWAATPSGPPDRRARRTDCVVRAGRSGRQARNTRNARKDWKGSHGWQDPRMGRGTEGITQRRRARTECVDRNGGGETQRRKDAKVARQGLGLRERAFAPLRGALQWL